MSPRFPHVTITGILMESGEERREGGGRERKKNSRGAFGELH